MKSFPYQCLSLFPCDVTVGLEMYRSRGWLLAQVDNFQEGHVLRALHIVEGEHVWGNGERLRGLLCRKEERTH